MIENQLSMGAIQGDLVCRPLLPLIAIAEEFIRLPAWKEVPSDVVVKINEARKDKTVSLDYGAVLFGRCSSDLVNSIF